MSLALVVYVLTAFGALAVVLTRLRFRGGRASGVLDVSPFLLNVHTVAGTLAIATWIAFLLTGRGEDKAGNAILGVVSLGFWWTVTIAGLIILSRWIPSKGKRARNEKRPDSWGGPALSVLAHVGMLLGVLVLTWAYMTSAV